MTKTTANLKVDGYLRKEKRWLPEFEKLRQICLATELTEELKWGHPCYTMNGKNVVLIHGFKEYCALLFFKGALLKDPQNILVKFGNVQAGRQIRFTAASDIAKMKTVLRAYIHEAIEAEKAGLKVKLKKTADFAVPEEFQNKLDASAKLKTAFEALTPGRQRGYLLHFAAAKQSKTRAARVTKCVPQILKGKGLND
ncbi:MAG TPA: DUF1801 domain-containing protein [Pirellulales bacterium]|nr:DUF1801 domain-containing protein [Pirellulales bacterium]